MYHKFWSPDPRVIFIPLASKSYYHKHLPKKKNYFYHVQKN